MQQLNSANYGARQPQFEEQVLSHAPYEANALNSVRNMHGGGGLVVAASGAASYVQHPRYDVSGSQQHAQHSRFPQDGRDTADYGHDKGRPLRVTHAGPGMQRYEDPGVGYASTVMMHGYTTAAGR
jgi:hypothetical protein